MERNVLLIEGRRDGSEPDQCCTTMSLSELISNLQSIYNREGDMAVFLCNDEGYTYGSVAYGESFEIEEHELSEKYDYIYDDEDYDEDEE